MPAEDDLQHASRLHRRWRGLGPLLFVIFYSLFFAAHLKLEKTDLYMVDGTWPSFNTASVFNDLVLPREHAGAKGTGKGSAFLLLHHAPARMLVKGWTMLSVSESSARRHAVATLTAGAAAVMVLLTYHTLMWAGLARLRAMLMAGILGGSASVMLMAVLPQTLIFSALGLTAVLAAVVRGLSARRWEFPVAAFYAMCCSPWNWVPVFLMGLVAVAPAFRGRGFVRPMLGLLGGALVLLVLVFGAMKFQAWFYPRTAMSLAAVAGDWGQALMVATGKTLDKSLLSSVLSDGIALRSWVPPFAKGPHLMILWTWRLLLLVAAFGLVAAVRRSVVAVGAALLALAWCGWLESASHWHVQTPQALWMPFLIFLVAVGLESYALSWAWLNWPLSLLQGVMLALLLLYSGAMINSFVAT